MTNPTKTLARKLRSEMTLFEQVLWRELQDLNRDHGTHFRRQTPIGRFIADFCEHTRKLIIEVDGCQHDEPQQAAHDAERTEWLASRGYCVIRFTNAEIAQSIEGVATEIMMAAGILGADSSIISDAAPTLGAISIKTRARIERQHARLSRRKKKDTPTPNPSPQGGGESASIAKAGASGEKSGGGAPIVPSPLAGEGQGGGCDAYRTALSAKVRYARPSQPDRTPSPQGGGEAASTAKAVAGGEIVDGGSPIVPSPLVGEGQGGGYVAAAPRNRGLSP